VTPPGGTITIGGDLRVSRLGYGAMRITGPNVTGEPKDPERALRVLRRVAELGITFIDTADSYGPEVSERLIAEALHPYPEGLVIATKGGLTRRDKEGPWPPDGRPEHLREACEGSLRRLKLERIDLYQLHRVDPKVPLEESVGALARLREEGKIRHVGLSNVSVDQLERAESIVPIVSVQNEYSVGNQACEDVLNGSESRKAAFIPWYPLEAGSLARSGGPLDRVAKAHDATPAQVALAWLFAHSPVILPIPGTSSVQHLEENVAATRLSLSDEELAELSGPVGVER
jgi:aryl-alcohol dehydrogenase-like predicted oxidoreductase